MDDKKTIKIQEFHPPRDVIERAAKGKGRPTIEDIADYARETIEDLDDFITDKKLKRRLKKEACQTLRTLKQFEGRS